MIMLTFCTKTFVSIYLLRMIFRSDIKQLKNAVYTHLIVSHIHYSTIFWNESGKQNLERLLMFQKIRIRYVEHLIKQKLSSIYLKNSFIYQHSLLMKNSEILVCGLSSQNCIHL